MGGLLAVLAGHPLDTLKIRLQVSNEGRSTIDVVRATLARGEVMGFYKGITAPLMAAAFLNAVCFGAKNNMESYIFDRTQNRTSALVSGAAFSGFCVAPINCFFDLIKCQLQVGKHKTVSDVIQDRLKHGGWRALMPGLSLFYLREVPSFITYFVTYHAMRSSGWSIFSHDYAGPIMAGGCAGMLANGVVHPVHVIQSRFQLQPYGTSISTVVSECTRIPRWWTFGLLVSIPRSFVVNGATFCGYENARHYWERSLLNY